MANNSTSSNPKVMVSSFTTGNRATETTSFRTVGDALTEGGISTTECILELTAADGTVKTCNVNSVLAEGDFLSIMKKSNKSGAKKASKVKTTKRTVYHNDFKNIDDMAGAVRGVLKSLTDKDGHYDRKEADTISNLFGKQINLIKVKLEAVKLSGGNAEKSKQLLS